MRGAYFAIMQLLKGPFNWVFAPRSLQSPVPSGPDGLAVARWIIVNSFPGPAGFKCRTLRGEYFAARYYQPRKPRSTSTPTVWLSAKELINI